MIDFRFIPMSPFRRRFPVGAFLSLLVAFGLAGVLLLTLRALAGAQSTDPPFTVTATGAGNYPTVTVTVTEVLSRAVSEALRTGQFRFCEDEGEQYCQNGAVVTPIGEIASHHLLVLLDTSLLFPDLSTWSAITRSVASLIAAMGEQDEISLLPFSNWVGTPTAWTSDKTQALRDLNAIRPDSTMTALNATLAEALRIAKAKQPAGRTQIVVIADRFDNTVNQREREQKLEAILQQAITAGVPIDFYCYGPFVATPFTEKVRALLEEGDGYLLTPPTAAHLEADLQRVRDRLDDFSHQFSFRYITKRPADGGMHKLNIMLNEPKLSATGQFSLDRRDINGVSLSFANIALTETKALTWATRMGQVSTEVSGWPLTITTVAYEVYVDKQPNSYGPFDKKEATIELYFTAITDVTVLQPTKERKTEIRVIVTDVNGNKGYRLSTFTIASPPAFQLAITPTEILADQVTDVKQIRYTIVAQHDITSKDKFLITLNDRLTSTLSLANTRRLSYSPPPFGLSFLRELSRTVHTTWVQLGKKTPAETHTLRACLTRFPTICRSREVKINPLSARESWRRFLWAWHLPLLLWPLALLLLLLLMGLVRAVYRLRVIEIPVNVENRGGLPRRCYLQAQEAPLPVNPNSLWYKWQQWVAKRFTQQEVLPSDWQNNPVLTARHLHHVRFSFVDPTGNHLTTTTPPVQKAPEQMMRTLSVLPLAKVQQLARRYHLSQSQAASFWRLSAIFARIPNRLRTRWQSMIAWLDRTMQRQTHQPISQANYTPTYVQSDWFPTQAIEPKPDGRPPQAIEVILRVESITWRPRQRVRIIVRASPDGIHDVCEYELELGLGAFWWRRPFDLISLKCL